MTRPIYTSRRDAEIAQQYAGTSCTLDGAPARIQGRSLPYAIVAALPNGNAAEFSWSAVERIMTLRDRAFRS